MSLTGRPDSRPPPAHAPTHDDRIMMTNIANMQPGEITGRREATRRERPCGATVARIWRLRAQRCSQARVRPTLLPPAGAPFRPQECPHAIPKSSRPQSQAENGHVQCRATRIHSGLFFVGRHHGRQGRRRDYVEITSRLRRDYVEITLRLRSQPRRVSW